MPWYQCIYTSYGCATFVFIFWCALWILHLLAIIYGKYKLYAKSHDTAGDEPYPGVSILKPLKGVDINLASNLETYFTMSYPLYELLFCVEEEDDPAVFVVQKLIEKYPFIPAKLYIGAARVGVNPKINNIQKAYEESLYGLILMSDSSIKMNVDTLRDMVKCMTDKTGLVHQLPFRCDGSGFAAALEKTYFGTVHSKMYLACNLLNVNCHTGMSSLLRKSVLDEVGGLKAFGCYLAEDYFIGKHYLDNGWRTTLSHQPAQQNSGACNVNNFRSRFIRWAKLRIAMVPIVIVLEPLSECMVIGACAAWASSVLFGWDVVIFYFIHILIWCLCDWLLLTTIQNGPLPFNKFVFFNAWIYRECVGPYLFMQAIFHPTVEWRDRLFKLEWGGVVQEIRPKIKC